MSRRGRIVRNTAIGIVALIIVVGAGGLLVLRTEWFRDYARREIISTTEDSTGGRVEIGSFNFDVSGLHATIENFVIHGNEPADSTPLLRVRRIEADIRLFTSLSRLINISYLSVDRPEANVLILPDGRTNIPVPKNEATPNESPLKTVVDLAVGHFELNDGLLALESRKQLFSLHANNLRAQLAWSVLRRVYGGEISLEPLYIASGGNTPVKLKVRMPITIGGDRIDVHQASISTSGSMLMIDGSVGNVKAPRITARISGNVAIADLKNAADLPLATSGRGVPAQIQLSMDVTASNDSIQIATLQATMGHSRVEASGALKSPRQDQPLTFRSALDLSELGKLLNSSVKAEGVLTADGSAKVDARNAYYVTGNINARNLALQQGATRIRNVGVFSAVRAEPGEVQLSDIELTVLGGRFAGSASLQDFQRYELNGNLRNFDVATLLSMWNEKVPYDGVISGSITAKGDTKAERSVVARARLAVAPGTRGTPVSGKLDANYNGPANDLLIGDSYLLLPHSRLDISGSLKKALNVSLKTRDLRDLVAVPSIGLNRGDATFTGTITGGLKTPQIAGHLAANRLVIEGRQFDSLAGDVGASGSGAAIRNGVLHRAAMNTEFSGSVGLADWRPLPSEPVSADLEIKDGDLADVAVLAGQNGTGYSGALTAMAHVSGTVGNPLGTASIEARNGAIEGQRFDQAQVQAELTDQLLSIPGGYIQSGAGRVDLNGEFRHPADSFLTGHLRAKLLSRQLDLAKAGTGEKWPNTSGAVQFNLEVAGDLTPAPQTKNELGPFLLTSLSGDVSARALRVEGRSYGDLNASARTNGQTTTYELSSDFAGSNIRLNGTTQLAPDYTTSADARIVNLPIDKALAAAKRADFRARGNLNGTVHLSGTLRDPQGDADLDLTRAVLYDEPIDRLQVRAAYLAQSIDVSEFHLAAGPSRIDLRAHYDHPAGDLRSGNASFNVESSRIDLARIHNIQTWRPGLGGALRITARGEGAVREQEPRIAFRELNATLAAQDITAEGKNFGDLNLTANTVAGNKVGFAVDSNLADASIHGRGTAELTAGYPVDGQVSFNNVLYTRIAGLLGKNVNVPARGEAAADGQLTLNGPMLKTEQLRANLQLTRLSITANPKPGEAKPVAIANTGPVTATLNQGRLQIQNAHLQGDQTDIQATGSASLPGGALELTVNAKAGLGILPNFDPDLSSSGNVDVSATVRGTVGQPLVNGQLTLHDAAFSYAGLPNGISNANGVVAFNGNSASIRNLTAESGGGRITVTGFTGYSGVPRFGLRVKASGVRVRLQQGVSVTTGADLQLNGTSNNSIISGSAVAEQVTYNPRTDIASLLSRAGPSIESPSAPSAVFDNMRLDIRVRTASGLGVQANIAENLSATADLHIQGTAARPGVLGRITINEGQLVFFGSTYTVDSGTIGFYNPLQVEPILDVSLETQTQGVDVVVRVTGPIENLKLTYTSNPPLQFQEIIALLASGKTPTSDPTLLANQALAPQSSVQQLGESALLGQALANPVSGSLQRVFGVSQLQIDPAFQTGTTVPTARLTLQQRITNNLTFTYTSALDDPNGQIIKVEWAFDPKWSVVATRDQNGIFSINFLYKRQFR